MKRTRSANTEPLSPQVYTCGTPSCQSKVKEKALLLFQPASVCLWRPFHCRGLWCGEFREYALYLETCRTTPRSRKRWTGQKSDMPLRTSVIYQVLLNVNQSQTKIRMILFPHTMLKQRPALGAGCWVLHCVAVEAWRTNYWMFCCPLSQSQLLYMYVDTCVEATYSSSRGHVIHHLC